MADAVILERIAAWERDGLIDAATGARLRSAEALRSSDPARVTPDAESLPAGGGRTAPAFGLNLDVGEAFAYLGSFFVLAAWYWFISQAAGDSGSQDLIYALGALVPAVVFAVLGVALRERPGRIGRSAGIWFLLSGIHVFVGAPLALSALAPDGTFDGGSTLGDYKLVFGAAAWLACALAFRRLMASVPTDLGLIAAILVLAGTSSERVARLLAPYPEFFDTEPSSDGAVVWMAVILVATVLATVAIGLLARLEARSLATDPGAGLRLALARVSAGATLAIGTALATVAGIGGFGRPVEPLIGDLMLLGVAAILSALAINRRAAAYIYPAGLAVLIAFTDLNAEYLSGTLGGGPALLIEGLALIAVGLAAQRGRRFVTRRPA